MTLMIPAPVLANTTHAALEDLRDRVKHWRNDSTIIPTTLLTDEVVADVNRAADAAGDKTLAHATGSILQARQSGGDEVIPSFAAAAEMLRAYLTTDLIDGWVYATHFSGHLTPYLVTDLAVTIDRGGERRLHLLLTTTSPTERRRATQTHTFTPQDLTRKKVSTVLQEVGLYKETADLKAAYEQTTEVYREVLTGGFAEQYLVTGTVYNDDAWGTTDLHASKVIHDIAPHEIRTLTASAPSVLFDPVDTDTSEEGVGPVPILPEVRVFDLGTHTFFQVHAEDMERYVYDPALREKIILPADQKDLLDILTSDLETFSSDIIQGKAAGSTILCKGKPGVGKTLTAEVYSEVMQRPLYSVHSGSLGMTAADVRDALETVFRRAKRWDAVLLLDEADVFVLERGSNLGQNAIVAEFLRTLEYFDGLLFMTTNRPDDIDEAILSRCVAIIDYLAPGQDDARRIWRVLADALGVEVADEVIDHLVAGLPGVAPRDMKMLLALSGRVAAAHGGVVDVETVRRCSMFRGLHFTTEA